MVNLHFPLVEQTVRCMSVLRYLMLYQVFSCRQVLAWHLSLPLSCFLLHLLEEIV